MKLQVVLAGATALALVAGATQAATHHHRSSAKSAGAYAEPSQPIAYSKLDSYVKASSRSRTKQSWGLESTGMAAGSATGSAANASATAPTTGVAPADQGAAAPAPSAAAPNPPATQDQPPAPQAAPDTSAQPPAGSAPQ